MKGLSICTGRRQLMELHRKHGARSALSDEAIISLYWDRNRKAITETDSKYGKYLYTIIYNILHDKLDCEECLNDTYLAAWNNIPPEYPVYYCGYLISIVRRIALSRVRTRCADRRGGGEYTLCFEELAECVPDGSDPQGEVEAKELAAAIERMLKKLSAADRSIFVSRYWLMEPVADIAGATGYSIGRVKSSLHRSREKLRKQLRKEGLI
jgi:RNA polymerase sigma-70 factor (ECF subfamily)